MLQKLRKISKRVIIIANLVVSLCFLLGCYTYLFPPESFWFIGLFNIAAFYFLLLLLLFVLFWLIVKPVFSILSIVTFLLAWTPVQNLVALRLPSSFAMEKTPRALRVMSWNIEHFEILEKKKHPQKREAMFELIRDFSPDIACFQEVVATESDSTATNYIPDLLKKLGFSYYHYTYNPRFDFDHQHHFGIAIFSRYPIINEGSLSFKPHNYNSIFQYVDMVKGNDTIRIFNLHLQSLKFNRNNLEMINNPGANNNETIKESRSIVGKFKRGFLARFKQSTHVAEEIAKSPYPTIVCGDFNDVPNSFAYHTIGKGLQNVFVEKGSGLGRTFHKISPTLRIDNIFIDKRFTTKQYVCIEKEISDHFPLIADLTGE